ncbi:MAG TPA: hypothetical protein VG389_21460, partial [Myxococcota bacterium]|nr:hypothetical protein [Myxococcota bacterium]
MGVPLHVTLAPAAAEPDLAGGTPVTVRFPDAGLAERAVRRLLALGNDRVAVAGTLADGGVLLRVAGPSYFLVQEWRETEGVTVYVAAAAAGAAGRAELWVEWGWRLREPEPARLGADGGPLAADRARGLVSWEGLAFRDLYAALQIHAGVLRGAAVESAGPPPQFSLTVRLVRRAVPAAPELWVLEASRAEELQALLDAATRAELRRLELACVTCGAQPLLILREVVTRGSSVGAGLRGAAYARLRGGGDVYVPVGWTLWPELRRDELARALGASVTGEALTIVEPAAGREANGAPGARAAGEAGTNVERAGGREANGGLAVWRVPAGAFGGIDRLVDWRIDALETDVRAALLGAVFDAEEPSARPARSPVTSSSLSARTSELGSASRSASQSRSAPAEAATAAEAGTPTAAEGPGGGKPSGADAPSGREPARPTSAGPAAGAAPKAEARAAPTVSPSGGAARSDAGANQHAAARLAVLERAVLDAPLEAGRWVEAAQGHLAAGRLADAEATAEVALCLRPEGEPAERAWAVLRAGRADGLGARLRAVAAGAARAEVVALLEALAAADPDWPIPRRWLAWRELSRATADAALLEQARTRILSALSLVGLEARDLPAFVAGRLAERSAGGATGPAASADGPPRALAVLEVLEAWSGALADADQRFAAGAALARARRALGRAAMPAPAAAAAAKLVALPLRARALMDVAAAIAADDPPGAAAAFDQALATLSGPELAHSEQQERLLLRALAVAGALAPPQAAPLLARLLAAVAPL